MPYRTNQQIYEVLTAGMRGARQQLCDVSLIDPGSVVVDVKDPVAVDDDASPGPRLTWQVSDTGASTAVL